MGRCRYILPRKLLISGRTLPLHNALHAHVHSAKSTIPTRLLVRWMIDYIQQPCFFLCVCVCFVCLFVSFFFGKFEPKIIILLLFVCLFVFFFGKFEPKILK